MSIEAIGNSFFLLPKKMNATEGTPQQETNFMQWLGNQISDTNKQLNAADNALTQLASGRTENLHETMITLEQAKLSFQYLEQIRNRLMSAYQELLREQI
jgi:flagellar hook-basal body complex protein FliE